MSLDPPPKQKPIKKIETAGLIILAQHPDLVKREEDVSTIIIAGLGYKLDKNYEDAIKSFDKAILLEPTNRRAYKFKADVLVELKKYHDSIECYNEALKIDPKDSIIWNYKGLSLVALGKYDDAVVCFDNAISLNPVYEALKNREYVK